MITVDANGEASTPVIPEWLSELLRHDAFIANYLRVWKPQVYEDAMAAYRQWRKEMTNEQEIQHQALSSHVALPAKGPQTDDDKSRGA